MLRNIWLNVIQKSFKATGIFAFPLLFCVLCD